jgi:NAD+ kinase
MAKEKQKFDRIAFVASEVPEALEAQQELIQRYGETEPAEADVIVALGGGARNAFSTARRERTRAPV